MKSIPAPVWYIGGALAFWWFLKRKAGELPAAAENVRQEIASKIADVFLPSNPDPGNIGPTTDILTGDDTGRLYVIGDATGKTRTWPVFTALPAGWKPYGSFSRSHYDEHGNQFI